jgi:hypothetical protein
LKVKAKREERRYCGEKRDKNSTVKGCIESKGNNRKKEGVVEKREVKNSTMIKFEEKERGRRREGEKGLTNTGDRFAV